MIKGYKFTKKKHPKKGIMATVLGLISVVSIITAIYLAYIRGGEAIRSYADAVVLALIFCITGLVIGIQSILQQDIYKYFPITGITLNSIGIIMAGFILYMGII